MRAVGGFGGGCVAVAMGGWGLGNGWVEEREGECGEGRKGSNDWIMHIK